MNHRKKIIPTKEFIEKIEKPIGRNDSMFVNILENGNFNLNGKLSKELAGR